MASVDGRVGRVEKISERNLTKERNLSTMRRLKIKDT